MRWLNTLALATCLVTVAVAQTSKIDVRLPRLRRPLIKLAVQPATVAAAPEGVAPITAAVAQGIYPYGGQYAAPQYWPGYLPQQNWLNPWSAPTAPYWGGYPTISGNPWSSYGSPYWSRRQILRNAVTPQVQAVPSADSAEVKTAVVDDLAKAARSAVAAETTAAVEPIDAAIAVQPVEEVPILLAANTIETVKEVPLVIAGNPLETADAAAAAAQPASPAEESSQAVAAAPAETVA